MVVKTREVRIDNYRFITESGQFGYVRCGCVVYGMGHSESNWYQFVNVEVQIANATGSVYTSTWQTEPELTELLRLLQQFIEDDSTPVQPILDWIVEHDQPTRHGYADVRDDVIRMLAHQEARRAGT